MIRLYRKFCNLLIIILILLCIFLFDSFIEDSAINKSIDEFKSRGVLVYEENNYSYYKISKKYDYEDCSNIIDTYTDINIGTIGDIYISNRDPLGGFFITEWISRISWIGHAGIIYSEDGSKTLEIVGNKSKEENVVKVYDNTWMKIDSEEYLILRVKGISNKEKEEIINVSNNLMGSRYNYLFLFSSNKRFYCTDLISNIYNNLDINLNKDYLFTTGSDIASNDNTYIIYYRERYIKNNKVCYNIYYLDED